VRKVRESRRGQTEAHSRKERERDRDRSKGGSTKGLRELNSGRVREVRETHTHTHTRPNLARIRFARATCSCSSRRALKSSTAHESTPTPTPRSVATAASSLAVDMSHRAVLASLVAKARACSPSAASNSCAAKERRARSTSRRLAAGGEDRRTRLCNWLGCTCALTLGMSTAARTDEPMLSSIHRRAREYSELSAWQAPRFMWWPHTTRVTVLPSCSLRHWFSACAC
jgi:hypothetical protein